MTWKLSWSKVGHSDLYFKVQWFCLISKNITCINDIFSNYESAWPKSDIKLNVGRSGLSFISQWVCLISWKYFRDKNHTFRLSFSSAQSWPQYECRGQWHISQSSDFALYLEEYLMTWNLTSKQIWVTVIYINVQWICLIAWEYFIYKHLSFQLWVSTTRGLTLK